MTNDYVLAKPVAWIEGEDEVQNLIFDLSDKITNATIPDGQGSTVVNRWEEVYRETNDLWVTYRENTRTNVQGRYTHIDGKSYNVVRVLDLTGNSHKDSEGLLHETYEESNTRTGMSIQVDQVTVTREDDGRTVVLDVPGLLLTNVDDPLTGLKKCYIVEQYRKELDGSNQHDSGWNEFQIVAEMPTDWSYALTLSSYRYYVRGSSSTVSRVSVVVASNYTFTERYYTANQVSTVRDRVVLKAVPDVPSNMPSNEYFVMFEQPYQDYNYIDVYYGLGFKGTQKEGYSRLTWDGVCDPGTVKQGQTPTIINQKEAELRYKMQIGEEEELFTPPTISWQKDIDEVTDIVSPPYHFFHGRKSTVPWVVNKVRRPDYKVGYWLSINNDRIAMVLEGDPAPSMTDFYRSYGYIGKIVPFNDYDQMGNFGITVGMGDLETNKTGMTLASIAEDRNPLYAGWGEYTSNGMYSMSMMLTRSNVFFQAYYPSFLTHLPNYPSVGTLPSKLKRLVVDPDQFQASIWTDKYHASPIYLVHKTEGYRGFLDGVVAIHDHNLVSSDELVVDTEVPKDPEDPSKGNVIEVYKFFSLISPVNFFKHSASPDTITVAILKETK